ncbi:hypothetical protein RvY_10643 [Ramazzottius varieornatus]|uniref:Uncharacterized protein n=1 Tax=Ramazzottius varieornatus TaxID=947166 RepID=A0A1D1VHX4_RAMVA|nr:hypothetical protein RvY_10643 [Ramazzottius varieornatus]
MPPLRTGSYVGPDASSGGLPFSTGYFNQSTQSPQLLEAFQATFECPQTQASLEISSITLPHQQGTVQCTTTSAESFQANTSQEALVQMSLKSPKATEKSLISVARFSKNVRAILPANQSSHVGSLSSPSAVLLAPVKHHQATLSQNILRPGAPMIVMQSESATKLHQMSNGLLSVSSSMNGVMTSSPSPSSLSSAISAPVTTATVKKTMVDKLQVLHDVKKKEAGAKARRSSVKTESKPKINMASLPNGVVTNGFTPPFTGSTLLNQKTVAKRAVDPENGASVKKRTKKKLAVEAVHEMILSATKSTSGGGPTFPPAPGLPVPVNEVPLPVVGVPEVTAPVTVTQSPLVSLLPSSSVVRHPVLPTNSHVSSLTADVIKALKLNREAPTGYHSVLDTHNAANFAHNETKMHTNHTVHSPPSKPNHHVATFPTENSPVVLTSVSSSENGAVRKKHRLILESGERKTQQINQQNSTASTEKSNTTVEHSHPVPKMTKEITIKVEEPDPPKTVKKLRKPRSDKGISPRIPKAKKAKMVVPVEKKIPVMLELKKKESEEQRRERLKKLAGKWTSLPEESLDWLVATKSVDCLKVIRWLRLVDRAFQHAESAKNVEKMRELRDSKIQAIMDLEKLQAPFEPRLQHFVHPDDISTKNHLLEKHCAGKTLSTKETRWLKDHFDRLCEAEKNLPSFSQLKTAKQSSPKGSSGEASKVVNGNERGNFMNGVGNENQPSSSSSVVKEKKPDKEGLQVPLQVSAYDVQTAHQFVRKFPDSTRAIIEVDKDDAPCAVLLLIQQPNSKAVHIKKKLKPPEQPYRSKDEALAAAAFELNYLSSKYLGMPQFPVQVRYPLLCGYLDEAWQDKQPPLSNPSFHEFNRTLRTWEAIHTIDEASFLTEQVPKEATPRLAEDGSSIIQKLRSQTGTRRPVDLTTMANDPVGQRRWLCWELRHLSQQYWDLEACQRERETWNAGMLAKLGACGVPDETVLKAARSIDLSRDGLKRPKASTALVNKTIKMGEQVRDVLESYKKERPMTRRKKAAKMHLMGI